nr:hypothetical protein [Bacteroidota bacterium]
MIRKIVSLLLFSMLTLSQIVNAQDTTIVDLNYYENKPPLLRKEQAYGFTINTEGFGLLYRKGFHKTGYRKWILEFEITKTKHPKEVKLNNNYYENAKPFIFGKLNYLLSWHSGVGEQRVIYSKGERGGVEVRLNYSGGLTLGLVKPVYLVVLNDKTPDDIYDIIIERYNPAKHDVDAIVGRASFFEGFGKSKIVPGLYAKAGSSFEWGVYDDDIKALEVGAMMDFYYRPVQLMAFNKAQQVYVGFYVSIIYGKKW